MKAVLLHAYGGVDQLSYEEVQDPAPKPGEVLVRTISVSLNPIDWKLRRGDLKQMMPLALPWILGRDLVGEVVALGSGVTDLKVGQVVFGLVDHTYAELVACKVADLAVLPEGLDPVDAAALPLVLLTGSQLIELGVKPQAGEVLLVTGALGGVGRTAVHVAKQHGATVIAGVRAAQLAEASSLQVSSAVAVDQQASVDGLPELDAIADTVGHEVIARLVPKLKKAGVLATVLGKPPSPGGQGFRVAEIWAKPSRDRLVQLASDVKRGEFSIPISKRLKLSEIREAHRLAEAGGVGKIIVTP